LNLELQRRDGYVIFQGYVQIHRPIEGFHQRNEARRSFGPLGGFRRVQSDIRINRAKKKKRENVRVINYQDNKGFDTDPSPVSIVSKVGRIGRLGRVRKMSVVMDLCGLIRYVAWLANATNPLIESNVRVAVALNVPSIGAAIFFTQI